MSRLKALSGELDGKARASTRLGGQLDGRPNFGSHLLHDRHAKSTAIPPELRASPKALEEMTVVLRRNSRTTVVNGQCTRGAHSERDGSAAASVQDRILQNVADDCLDQASRTPHVHFRSL